MTFCGDLPFVPSGIHHHLFENLRRKGHHCHGLTHLSWAERKIFYRVLGKKLWAVHLPWTVSAAGCGCISPRRQGLRRCMAPDTTTGRDRRNDVKHGLRNGVAPYIPAAFSRDARSAGHGATEAARPERSLQARGFASGMEARQGGDSFAGSVHDSRPARGTPGKGISRRTTKQTIIRAAVIRVRAVNQSQSRRKKENNQREGDVISGKS